MHRTSAVAGAFLLGFVLTVGAGAQEPGRSCLVQRISGTEARVWLAGVWSDLSTGGEIGVEAKVVTGSATRVEILCSDGIVLTIGVSTEVNLERLVAAAPRNVVLQLIDGILGMVAPPGWGAGMEVRAPLAIASVRSTEWLLEHRTGSGTAVFVRDGAVGVRAVDGTAVVLGEGEGITVTPDGAAGDVVVWGAPRIARSGEALGFGWR